MKFKKFTSIGLIVLLCCALLTGCGKQWKMLKIGWMKYTADVNPPVREFEIPKQTQWKPEGKRQIQVTSDLMPRRNIWRARHGDAMNSDEVTTVIGPVLEVDWVSETDYFNPASASFDSKGDIYNTPQFPADKTLIEKLDSKSGKLLWKIYGTKRPTGGGRPLVLSDPDNPGKEIIYQGEIAEVVAVHPNGKVIYQKPTGFPEPPETATFENLGEFNSTGPNYNPIIDGLVWVTGTGMIYAVDRKTGERNIEPLYLPGKPSPGKDNRKLPKAIKKLEREELDYEFKGTPEGYTLAHQLAVILGERVVNSNYFSVDQTTGAMWIAATDLDEKDGKKDGISEYGALYRIDVVSNPAGKYRWKMEIGAKLSFEGGSASTPALRGDGQRGYVGDAFGNMIAFDYDCNLVWKYSLGSDKGADQIGGSIAVSSDNGELYAITRRDVIKIVDKGDHAELAWRAKIDMYENVDSEFHQWNLNTATITANGVAFLAGVGPAFKLFGDTPVFLPVKVGAGLLDRKTGELRWFADGKDKGQSSLAMVMPTPDGGVLIAHSPLRRAIARGLFGDRIHPTRGGFTKYSPKRIDMMIRDIAVAASDKINRGIEIFNIQPEGTTADLVEVKDLINQARFVAPNGIEAGDISREQWNVINEKLETVEKLHLNWENNQDVNLLKQSVKILKEIAEGIEKGM
jgi:outer membrane protein assembly factor BamB